MNQLKRSLFGMAGLLLAASALFSCLPGETERQTSLIPKPAQITWKSGFFKVDSNLVFAEGQSGTICETIDPSLPNPDGYSLDVTPHGIELKAASDAGLFYGKQTLRQLYTPDGIPCVSIVDEPRFSYRGLHLDVSRHFFPKEEILKLLDAMAYYKLNKLHLHLTDGGGWRLQVDSYPKLTAEAAFRTQSDWLEWWDGKDRQFVPEGTDGAYGGYYTKNDICEIVAYAARLHIDVVPEIEFPGHSNEVFVAYPELCCTGKPYTSGDFCVGNERSFAFMEEVLSEVVELFPYEYVHIGGDEASKRFWKTCPKCQALMRREGMQSVDELQSYMIRRAEEFLKTKGRKLIGWDEILEGGLAPEATVMSWRGESGGIKSARMGHDVVMTPMSFLYFDFYQANPTTQPYAIGGYTPVRTVYGYDPVPADSLDTDQRQRIIGVQANTWTEYIKDEKHLEYMMFPRALAVAEIAWTPQERRDWADFKPRLNANLPVLRQMGINAFPLSDEIDITMAVDTSKREIRVSMDAEKYPAEIRYTTDGTTPTSASLRYKHPISVSDSAHFVASIFRDGQPVGEPTAKNVDYHRGINKPIHYNNKLFAGYMAGGINALLDGYRGGLTYLDGRWQGYLDDLDCVVDMGEITSIHKVSTRFMQLIGPDVYQPASVELLTSEDGELFESRGTVPTDIPSTNRDLSFQEYTFCGQWKARYVRLKAHRANRGFIFADEVVIW